MQGFLANDRGVFGQDRSDIIQSVPGICREPTFKNHSVLEICQWLIYPILTKMRSILFGLLACAGTSFASFVYANSNCPDDPNCCFKDHAACNKKYSKGTCNRLGKAGESGPTYCRSCGADCCSFDSATYPPNCSNGDSDCWTSAPNLAGTPCQYFKI